MNIMTKVSLVGMDWREVFILAMVITVKMLWQKTYSEVVCLMRIMIFRASSIVIQSKMNQKEL